MEKITENEFEEKINQANGVVVVDFGADWCIPCHQLGNILEELTETMSDVQFYKVDVDSNPELVEKFQVKTLPTMFLYKDGELKDSKVRLLDEDEISDWINSFKD